MPTRVPNAVAVSLINMKGGVGKTTVASQLAHAASEDGLRVLAVDLDPQSNLSHVVLGSREYKKHLDKDRPTVAEVLDPRHRATVVTPSKVILKVRRSLDLLPSRLELSRILKKPGVCGRRLSRFLARVGKRYDLIIIDCAPTESILTDAAYYASRYLIVPVKPEFMATVGLPLLARSIAEFRKANANHAVDIAGLVMNDQSGDSDGSEKKNARREVKSLAQRYRWHVFRQSISYSRSYAKAARGASSLAKTPYARAERIEAFRRLKNEILHATGIRPRRR